MVGSLCAQILPAQSEIEQMTSFEKYSLYKMNKKHPFLGTLFSLYIPSTGHLYSDNWNRGLKFAGAQIGSTICIIIGYDKHTNVDTKKVTYTPNEVQKLGILSLVVFRIWEIIDAGKTTKTYNNKLYKSIYGKEPPSFSLNLQPTYQGANLTTSYAFD